MGMCKIPVHRGRYNQGNTHMLEPSIGHDVVNRRLICRHSQNRVSLYNFFFHLGRGGSVVSKSLFDDHLPLVHSTWQFLYLSKLGPKGATEKTNNEKS